MLDWDNLRVFLTAVRAGNYTAASKLLRVDRTTVGRRLERLEYQLGLPLFEQEENGYRPTPAGRRALEVADQVERLLDGLTTELTGLKQLRRGHIRLALSVEIGLEFLEDIAAFRAEHGDVDVTIASFANPADSVLQRRSDLALCLGDRRPAHLRGQRIGPLFQSPYASKDYLARAGGEAGLEAYDWIIYADSTQMPATHRWFADMPDDLKIAVRVDSWAAMKEVALRGMGVARMWRFVADDLPDLVRLGGSEAERSTDIWLLVRDDVPIDPKVRMLMDFLADRIRRRLALQKD